MSITQKPSDGELAKAISSNTAKEVAYHKEVVKTFEDKKLSQPLMLNKTTCKHNSKARKDGLCSKCAENKPFTIFKWCDVKTCPKDATCTHAGYFSEDGSKITYTKEIKKQPTIVEVAAVPVPKPSNPLEEWMLNLLTVFGQMKHAECRCHECNKVVRVDGQMMMDNKTRNQLLADGWKLYVEHSKSSKT
jgi:hypothetical protein